MRQTGISNVTFREGDVEDIEFLEGSFDAILCSSAFPYLRDKEASLQGIYSWLKKPGGVLAYNAVKVNSSYSHNCNLSVPFYLYDYEFMDAASIPSSLC